MRARTARTTWVTIASSSPDNEYYSCFCDPREFDADQITKLYRVYFGAEDWGAFGDANPSIPCQLMGELSKMRSNLVIKTGMK